MLPMAVTTMAAGRRSRGALGLSRTLYCSSTRSSSSSSSSATAAGGPPEEERPLATTAPLEHGVSHTSLLTAALRAREQQEESPLFYDPYSPLLGDEGLALMAKIDEEDAKLQAGKGRKGARVSGIFIRPETIKAALHSMVPIRHKFFDDYIQNSVDKIRDGNHHRRGAVGDALPLQFVNLACGLDSRAFRLPWPRNTKVFEVDRAEVLKYKDGRLSASGARPLCAEHHMIHADVVTDPWEDMLLERGFDPTLPSIWLAEGLLPYLPEPEVTRLLKRMRALAPPGSFVGADHPGTRLKDSAASAAIRTHLDKMKAPLISSTDDPEGLLKSCGWDAPAVASLGDETAHYGRWPFRPTPRWVPALLVPRFWLMTAMASQKFRPDASKGAAAASS